MTPIIACGMQVRTRSGQASMGWPGTFRPSGLKQTQIPPVMAILVGPSCCADALPSQKSHSWPA